MSGLPWIKVEVIAANHPKLQRLEKRLGIEDGLGVAVRLWCWTASYHPNGEIPLDSAEVMGAAAIGHVKARGMVPSNADVTLALVEVGLVEKHDDRYEVHDWSLHQQAHADKAERDREQNRERQRRFRNRQGNNKVTLPRNVTNNVTVTPCNGGDREGDREREKKLPTTIRTTPPTVALQGQCPVLFEFLTELAKEGHPIEHGRVASVWGRADGLVTTLGMEPALVAAIEALDRRKGEDIPPLAYVVKVLESAASKGRPKPQLSSVTDPDPDPGCPEWGATREKIRGQVRHDLWRWFRPLRGRVAGGELVLVAPDAFHANFTRDTYGSFLTEQAGMPVRIEAAQ